MKNTIWSGKLQGILTLDMSRELRFRDDRKDLLLYILHLQPGMTILEVGCGPGALSRKLAKWLGDSSKVVGIDRDSDFIEYARRKAGELGVMNVEYVEGDALSLPFEDNSFDACVSHTVVEHVPNTEFLSEQKRVCKDGGRVSVLFSAADKAIVSIPEKSPQITDREKELWKVFEFYLNKANDEYIRDHWSGCDGLPRLFDDLDFKDITVDAIALPVVADDYRNTTEDKKQIVEYEYKTSRMEAMEIAFKMSGDSISIEQMDELRNCIEKRFLQRMQFIEADSKIWDYKISTVLITGGNA